MGHEGDVVELKYGYVYNFLVPTKRASLVKDPTVQTSRASALVVRGHKGWAMRNTIISCMPSPTQSDPEVVEQDLKRRIRQLDTTLMSVLSNVVVCVLLGQSFLPHNIWRFVLCNTRASFFQENITLVLLNCTTEIQGCGARPHNRRPARPHFIARFADSDTKADRGGAARSLCDGATGAVDSATHRPIGRP